jgi:hypothetical protein
MCGITLLSDDFMLHRSFILLERAWNRIIGQILIISTVLIHPPLYFVHVIFDYVILPMRYSYLEQCRWHASPSSPVTLPNAFSSQFIIKSPSPYVGWQYKPLCMQSDKILIKVLFNIITSSLQTLHILTRQLTFRPCIRTREFNFVCPETRCNLLLEVTGG